MPNLAMTAEEEKQLDSQVEPLMDWAKARQAEAEQLALDSARLMACTTDKLDRLSKQGFFQRCWSRFSGQAGEMERATQADVIQMQKMAFRYVNMLQEQQVLMAHSLLSLKNNLCSLAVAEEETRNLVALLAQKTLERFQSLENRVEQIEISTNLQGWLLGLEEREYDEKIPTENMRLFRVINDFYGIKNDNWNYNDLMFMRKAIRTVGIDPKKKISLNTFIDTLTDEIQSEAVGFDAYGKALGVFQPKGIKNYSQYVVDNISSPVFVSMHTLKTQYMDRLDIVEELQDEMQISTNEALKRLLRRSIAKMNVNLDYEFPLAETAIEILGCLRLSEKLANAVEAAPVPAAEEKAESKPLPAAEPNGEQPKPAEPEAQTIEVRKADDAEGQPLENQASVAEKPAVAGKIDVQTLDADSCEWHRVNFFDEMAANDFPDMPISDILFVDGQFFLYAHGSIVSTLDLDDFRSFTLGGLDESSCERLWCIEKKLMTFDCSNLLSRPNTLLIRDDFKPVVSFDTILKIASGGGSSELVTLDSRHISINSDDDFVRILYENTKKVELPKSHLFANITYNDIFHLNGNWFIVGDCNDRYSYTKKGVIFDSTDTMPYPTKVVLNGGNLHNLEMHVLSEDFPKYRVDNMVACNGQLAAIITNDLDSSDTFIIFSKNGITWEKARVGKKAERLFSLNGLLLISVDSGEGSLYALDLASHHLSPYASSCLPDGCQGEIKLYDDCGVALCVDINEGRNQIFITNDMKEWKRLNFPQGVFDPARSYDLHIKLTGGYLIAWNDKKMMYCKLQ